MNLFHELNQYDFKFSLTSAEEPDAVRPGRMRTMIRLTFNLDDTTVIRDFSTSEHTLEKMLALTLTENFKKHPLTRAWYDSHGNTPVSVSAGALKAASELIHVALRKSADSKQSVITWNAFHRIHPLDFAGLMNDARQAVRFEMAKKPNPSRRKIGQALKKVFVEGTDSEKNWERANAKGASFIRNAEQEFALKVLYAGCALTENAEWTWDWTAYLCESFEQQEPNSRAIERELAAASTY